MTAWPHVLLLSKFFSALAFLLHAQSMSSIPQSSWHLLLVFPAVLLLTAPIRAFKDVLYPNFNPQDWSLISSKGILNRTFANHCFEIFLIAFIITNAFKIYIVKRKSPLLPTVNDNIEMQPSSSLKSKSDLILQRYLQNPEMSSQNDKDYSYTQCVKLGMIYGSISLCIIWFFGASLYDRIHRASGGYCVNHAEIPFYRDCKRLGFEYEGGFKSSGHSLITTVFATCLGFEILSLWNWLMFVNSLTRLASKVKRMGEVILISSLLLYVIWLSVFTVTCLFYHTLGERIVGTMTGCSVVFFVFIKYNL